MTVKEKIQNLVLNGAEDINQVDEICEDLKTENYPKELLEDLFKILEKNPHFNFGMPGNLMRAIEKHYKEPYYQDFVMQSIERYPTEYNLWLLQRLMNTFETDCEKEKGVNIFLKILQETKDNGIKEMLEDFMTDYE
jgi:spore coat polysaccharide biosynthesis protein SpsF (cytidylyltransferase family)